MVSPGLSGGLLPPAKQPRPNRFLHEAPWCVKNNVNRATLKKVTAVVQRNHLACVAPQAFGMLKLGKIISGLGLKQRCIQHD